MAKRNMKESMDNITNIKDSTAALSPEMQLAKEKAKDKDEEFEKIVLSKDGVLGASKQPTPDKPKWSLDESLFDKPVSLVEMWDQGDDELDIDSVLDLVYDGSIDSITVVDFLSDHETAFEDACKAFGVSSDDFDEQCEALNQEDPEDLVNWVSDHELLWSDFCNYVSNQLDQFNESLKKKGTRRITEAMNPVVKKVRDFLYDEISDFISGQIPCQYVASKMPEYQEFDWPEDFNPEIEDRIEFFIGKLADALVPAYFMPEDLNESLKEAFSDDLKKVNLNKFNVGTLPYQVLQFLWDLSENGKLDDRSLERQANNILELINRNISNESLNESTNFVDKDTLKLLNTYFRNHLGEGSTWADVDSVEVIGKDTYKVEVHFKGDNSYSSVDSDGYKYTEHEDTDEYRTYVVKVNGNKVSIIDNESLRKDKNMKRYIIEEMNDEITDVDAYNESRDAKLVKRYKSILGLDEDFEITEENLDDWALKHACSLEGANYDRAKAAVLGLKFEGYK